MSNFVVEILVVAYTVSETALNENSSAIDIGKEAFRKFSRRKVNWHMVN